MEDKEKKFAEPIIARLSKYFYTRFEVLDVTEKNRIDWILKDKEHGKYFGIEFKQLNENKRGEEIGEHILQSMRYACAEFLLDSKPQRIPIMICPPISFVYLQAPDFRSLIKADGVYGRTAEFYHDRHDRFAPHHTMNGLLGAMLIGEIRTHMAKTWVVKMEEKQYMRFMFSNKILWDESPDYNTKKAKGIHLVNYNFQISKPITYTVK